MMDIEREKAKDLFYLGFLIAFLLCSILVYFYYVNLV